MMPPISTRQFRALAAASVYILMLIGSPAGYAGLLAAHLTADHGRFAALMHAVMGDESHTSAMVAFPTDSHGHDHHHPHAHPGEAGHDHSREHTVQPPHAHEHGAEHTHADGHAAEPGHHHHSRADNQSTPAPPVDSGPYVPHEHHGMVHTHAPTSPEGAGSPMEWFSSYYLLAGSPRVTLQGRIVAVEQEWPLKPAAAVVLVETPPPKEVV